MYIKIDHDELTNAIAADIKESIITIVNDPYSLYHDTEKSYNLVLSMLNTLSYYTLENEHKEFVDAILDSYEEFAEYANELDDENIVITDIIENEDGSASIAFDVKGDENTERLLGDGIKYSLILAAMDCSEDDLIKWAIRGKEEEKIDERVSKELSKRGL